MKADNKILGFEKRSLLWFCSQQALSCCIILDLEGGAHVGGRFRIIYQEKNYESRIIRGEVFEKKANGLGTGEKEIW